VFAPWTGSTARSEWRKPAVTVFELSAGRATMDCSAVCSVICERDVVVCVCTTRCVLRMLSDLRASELQLPSASGCGAHPASGLAACARCEGARVSEQGLGACCRQENSDELGKEGSLRGKGMQRAACADPGMSRQPDGDDEE
jgi:hypothetical protein